MEGGLVLLFVDAGFWFDNSERELNESREGAVFLFSLFSASEIFEEFW